MTIDVIDLRDFYSQRLGIVARQLINRGIRARWPDAKGQRVLGLGYPTPYLGLFREDSERCLAFMPAAQGVLKWPTARPALATLIDEFSMPLPDAAVDRILMVHALEMSDDPEGLLREMWRVLKPGGKLIFFELGLSPDPKVQRRQKQLEPLHHWLFQGLYLTRDIPSLLVEGGFQIEQMQAGYMAQFPKSSSYCWWGSAISQS